PVRRLGTERGWPRDPTRSSTSPRRAPSGKAPAVPAPGMAITVGRATLSVSVPGEVGLELIEEPATTFSHPESGQPVAWRARVVELRLGEARLHALPNGLRG